ncbi:Method: conceptual translation supplied by author.; putative L1 [Human papillomavirus type 70]|uniref:Major capsid protein L1 n=2 Tax=Human papillomavirus type 70 TaxID=39457 RepID=VL1_HPV70|nr:RecName: Full=Major capsid protein L1 [Human papillomavirus type 70]AAC54857.1 Method: conceptual translation supplied by author.; putative L1 [Human papillomavirus type 70]AGU90830.1 L1 [Human papillomavirus type 70]prf//2211363H L1 gene [Human papillomavirus type 70]
MALWRSSDNTVYLPPPSVAKVVNTDDYVTRTGIYYYAGSSRLLTVGHPYFKVPVNGGRKQEIPKVSAYQYRVFRVSLPDPNKFGLPDPSLYNPDTQRLVWACIGVEIGRGQPLGVGVSGHPLYNRLDDTENSHFSSAVSTQDSRDNVSVDYKQTQLCIIGCVPAMGEHWAKGKACKSTQQGDCPPLELVNTAIEDGDMIDTGYGAMDFRTLQETKSEVPLDICQSVCKYPDYLQMSADVYGDSMFFCLRKEQLFARHFWNRGGMVGDTIPSELYIKGTDIRERPGTHVYSPSPSGSMVSSDSQLFNKPYWLHKAQGHNNGICWHNQLFITVVDTTRSTNFTLSACTETAIPAVYSPTKFKEYTRHVEEYDLQFIFQLCTITLTADVMAYIHTMNPAILDNWNIGVTPPPSASLVDTYRYLQSAAIACQKDAPTPEKKDPYDDLKFWNVDLKEKFSTELDQFPLGRKFLLQVGARRRPTIGPRKRPASAKSSSSASKHKRKRVSK